MTSIVLPPVSCPAVRICHCEGRRYTCPGCLRFVPWCFGVDDEHPELCDDCDRLVSEGRPTPRQLAAGPRGIAR